MISACSAHHTAACCCQAAPAHHRSFSRGQRSCHNTHVPAPTSAALSVLVPAPAAAAVITAGPRQRHLVMAPRSPLNPGAGRRGGGRGRPAACPAGRPSCAGARALRGVARENVELGHRWSWARACSHAAFRPRCSGTSPRLLSGGTAARALTLRVCVHNDALAEAMGRLYTA